MHPRHTRHGFTFFQLSITMAVIALVTGGILTAGNIQHNARLQDVIADLNSYRESSRAFREKYLYLPGDFSTATNYWSSSANGNGDGFIGGSTGTVTTIGSNSTESLYAWQHLAYAGFIEGNYNAVTSAYTPGANIPASLLNNRNGYTISYATPTSATASLFAANYRHIIVYGSTIGVATTATASGFGMSPPDAANIDKKMDDGKPGYGNLLVNKNGTCASNASTYNISATSTNLCALFFITGF